MTQKDTIGKVVATFLVKNPNIRESLLLGLINYSALARRICADEGISRFEGVVVACRRYAQKHKISVEAQQGIDRALKHLHVSVVHDMTVTIINKPFDQRALAELKIEIRELRGECNLVEGRDQVTLVHSDRFTASIAKVFNEKVRRTTSRLAQICIVFDDTFETTPGVVARIYSCLAAEGVNVREELSCGTDLLLVVDEGDVERALRAIGR